jgi:hypothetical protein
MLLADLDFALPHWWRTSFRVERRLPYIFTRADIAGLARERGFACYKIRSKPVYCLLAREGDCHVCVKFTVNSLGTRVSTRQALGPAPPPEEILGHREEQVERL